MGLAEKYRKNFASAKKSYLECSRQIHDDRKKLEEEERTKRKEWQERKKQLAKQDVEQEAALVATWGGTVMASGFADAYENNFELRDVILRTVMKQMEEDPAEMDKYLALMKEDVKAGRKEKKTAAVPEAVPAEEGSDEMREAV